MRLALFTPVAYIWPVHRSFEAFLASLAMPARDAQDVASSPLYPATVQADSPPQGLPPRLDERLLRLHRSLYDAMLRPLGFFAREHAGFSDYFYADLHGTAFELLLSAFVFHFIRREARTLPVATGLTVFRTTFFNHEASEPAHWVDTALSRLAPERDAAQLWNILRGDMSFVGPRPALFNQEDLIELRTRNGVHSLTPGLTGWAQVNGRNALTWEQKFALDVWYVDHQSLWLDLKIMALTMCKILKREGINQPGRTTTDEFMGSHT